MKKIIISLWLSLWVKVGFVGATVPAACHRASAEVNLARECFSNEMHAADDFGVFVNTQENADGRAYCIGAFIYAPPARGAEIGITVVKDDPKGLPHAYTYAYDGSKSRRPASAAPPALTFTNLTAKCYSTHPTNDACRAGLMGLKRADVPLTVEFSPSQSPKQKWAIRGPLVEKAAIEDQTRTERLQSRGEIEAKAFDLWLLQLTKQKLLSHADRGLAGEQGIHCRMAFDGFIHAKHLADPLSPVERKLIER